MSVLHQIQRLQASSLSAFHAVFEMGGVVPPISTRNIGDLAGAIRTIPSGGPTLGKLSELTPSTSTTIYIMSPMGLPVEYMVIGQAPPSAEYVGWDNATFLMPRHSDIHGSILFSSLAQPTTDYENSQLHQFINSEEYIDRLPLWLQSRIIFGRIPYIPGINGTSVSAGDTGLLCRFFTPSAAEVRGSAVADFPTQGAGFEVFVNNFTRQMSDRYGGRHAYHLRDINTSGTHILNIATNGSALSTPITHASHPRPIFALPSSTQYVTIDGGMFIVSDEWA